MNTPQHAAFQGGETTKRAFLYNRQYVIVAVYEVLDKSGAEYRKTGTSTVSSEMSVYGNRSRFSISVDERGAGTELSITMAHPCEGLSPSGVQRALNAVADSISQYLENELVMNAPRLAENA